MQTASAKIIISGEHAVVYGAPAIGMVVNSCFTTTTISSNTDNRIHCFLENFNIAESIEITSLRGIKKQIDDLYSDFLNNKITIDLVLNNAVSIISFLIALFLEKNNIKIHSGFDMRIKSNIPIGSGMGSSAALIVSIIRSLEEFYMLKMDEKSFFDIARMTESLQHGHTSGLDIKIIMNNGLIYLEDGKIQARDKLPGYYLVVNTGIPKSTTGQCVVKAREYLNNKDLLGQFISTTKALDLSIRQNNIEDCQKAVRENHHLLSKIGVVPNKIQEFINSIEQIGAVGKISGAGSAEGDKAGCVLILCKNQQSAEASRALAESYGYQVVHSS